VKEKKGRERKSLLKKIVSWFCGQEKQNPVRAEFRLTRSEAELGFAMERTSGVKQRIPELL
jgi:Flp pilus assembly protein TadB